MAELLGPFQLPTGKNTAYIEKVSFWVFDMDIILIVTWAQRNFTHHSRKIDWFRDANTVYLCKSTWKYMILFRFRVRKSIFPIRHSVWVFPINFLLKVCARMCVCVCVSTNHSMAISSHSRHIGLWLFL